MKNNFGVTSVIFIFFIFTQKAFCQDTLTLEECINTAVRKNLVINNAGLNSESAAYDVSTAKSLYYPSIQADIQDVYNWGLFIDPSTNILTTRSNEIYKGGIEAELELFNGGFNYYNLQATKSLLQAAKANKAEVSNEVKILVITNFFRAFLASEQVNLSNTQILAAQKQSEMVKGMVDAGVLHRREYSQAVSDLALRESELMFAENAVKLTKLQLKQLLELKDTSFVLKETFPQSVPPVLTPTPYDSVSETGKTQLPEVKRALYALNASKYAESRVKALRYPSLSLSAGIITRSSSLQNVEQSEQFKNNLSEFAGFRLRFPVFQGFRTNYLVQQAKINSDIQKNLIGVAKNEVEREIYQAYLDLLSSHKRYWALTQKEEALEQEYEYFKKAYLAGLVNYTEYNYVYSQYNSVQIELLQAKYDYFLKKELYNFYQNPENWE